MDEEYLDRLELEAELANAPIEGIAINQDLNLIPTLHMTGEIIVMDGDVEITGDEITINGNINITGNLNLNGSLQTNTNIINTNKLSEINFFNITLKDGVVYINDKLITNPSEIGLYMLQISNNLKDDNIKSIEDL